MMRNGNRTIKVNKQRLIDQIKENKKNHIEEYEKAVVAYKEEALRQLAEQIKRVEDGDLNARLNLVTPVDCRDNYDKIVEMYEWEVSDEVELDQNEFREYVQDETSFALQARISNMSYFAG